MVKINSQHRLLNKYMNAYEFQAAVNGGVIQIPAEYRNKVSDIVKVILSSEESGERHESVSAAKKTSMMDNPLHVEDFKRFSRDELHERWDGQTKISPGRSEAGFIETDVLHGRRYDISAAVP